MQDQGGLARAVRAEQRDPLTTGDAQVDPEERLVAVGIGVGEPAHLQGGSGYVGTHASIQAPVATHRAVNGSTAAVRHWAVLALTSRSTGMVPV